MISLQNRLVLTACPYCRVLLALQGASGAVRSACPIRTQVLLIATLLASAGLIHGDVKTSENAPLEITSTGETTYEHGLATARDHAPTNIRKPTPYAHYNPTQ